MIVENLSELIDSDRDIRGDGWASRRFLTANDNCGFTLTETTVDAGSELTLWYKHHIEANYVIAGEGEVEDLDTGKVYSLSPGTVYTLNGNERHCLRAHSTLKLVCVFNPALTGAEVHDEDGAYALPLNVRT